eukprot:CAMPEP_0170386524 /NCGR_PEP_ID=MMETSP0117_2-20130122/17076_1 /TAXON_ID=400756 /ORGANISM="Durinskia baltica, Strain CSIRO CS-38" /LENGTH=37 /DNA_ID= /DNA_START= /DNA_END= /DNA_ORIENTATION=
MATHRGTMELAENGLFNQCSFDAAFGSDGMWGMAKCV